MLNEDYRDMLRDLVDEKVNFLVIGAYAMAAHGYLRATVDIDIWVMASPDNADSVLRAVKRFGAPLGNLNPADLQKDDTVFQIGVAPRRIDILTGVSGLRFDEAFKHSIEVDFHGTRVRIPSLDDLIRNKKASSRTRDLADVEALESLRESEESGASDTD